MKLYEITNEMSNLKLEEIDDINIFNDTLEGLQLSFDQKAINIWKLIKNIETPILAIDNEIKRLQNHKKAIQNNIERFKNYLKENMEANEIDCIESDLIKIRLQNSESVEIIDLNAIPDDLKATVIEVIPSKTYIKKYLKENKEVPGAQLKQSKFIRFY